MGRQGQRSTTQLSLGDSVDLYDGDWHIRHLYGHGSGKELELKKLRRRNLGNRKNSDMRQIEKTKQDVGKTGKAQKV